MKFNACTPQFQVSNLEEAQKFFENMLGWTVSWTWEKCFCAVGWGTALQIYLKEESNAQGGFSCYFHVEDADVIHKRCVENGGDIFEPLETKPWGQREFGLKGPNGHIFRIGHNVKKVDEIEQFS